MFQFPSNGKGFPNGAGWFPLSVEFSSVSIPFKRERLSEHVYGIFLAGDVFCFNSLQTGKAFRTFRRPCGGGYLLHSWVSIPFKRERLSEHNLDWVFKQSNQHVSIPFKRERLSEQGLFRSSATKIVVSIPFKRERLSEHVLRNRKKRECFSFNSLQTGKAFRTLLKVIWISGGFCFNSLQTGKAFRTWNINMEDQEYDVSIPFKRERLSELIARTLAIALILAGSFNSLQTGKAFRTESDWTGVEGQPDVSIPFKRERLSELIGYLVILLAIAFVSIPFKRERLSEHAATEALDKILEIVSIPFKRERLSERVGRILVPDFLVGFNSLQTGKAFRTDRVKSWRGCCCVFQFPSNGKGFPNVL